MWLDPKSFKKVRSRKRNVRQAIQKATKNYSPFVEADASIWDLDRQYASPGASGPRFTGYLEETAEDPDETLSAISQFRATEALLRESPGRNLVQHILNSPDSDDSSGGASDDSSQDDSVRETPPTRQRSRWPSLSPSVSSARAPVESARHNRRM